MRKLHLLLVSIFFCQAYLYAAWLDNYPLKVAQPDGTVLNLFATGDEYHNRVHDADGYTLLRNDAGWVVYATLNSDGNLAPSDILYSPPAVSGGVQRVPSRVQAQQRGIVPNIDISAARWRQLRNDFNAVGPAAGVPQKAPAVTTAAQRSGTMNNVVIYISFPDARNFTKSQTYMQNIYNSTANGASLKSYFRDISNNQFNINSTFYPAPKGTTILSYRAPNNRSYYEISNSTQTGQNIEWTLLRAALTYCKTAIESVLSAGDLDYNNDGWVDNVNFVIQGDVGNWSTLLWPHKWNLYPYDFLLNGKKVNEYNLLLENHFDVGNGAQSVLVHETYHTLGAPDFYMYSTGGVILSTSHPVGSWDVMCSNTIPPQSSTAYTTSKYGKFISDIPEITTSGNYTLYDIWNRTGNPIAYKIMSPVSTKGEYFVLEYRSKSGTFGTAYDSSIPNSGIIISRINPTATNGNADADGTAAHPFEMYVYRSGASNNTTSGSIGNAAFKQGGLTTFSDASSPSAFLSNGSAGLGGIVIDNFSAAGGATMTFRVTFPSSGTSEASDATNISRTGFTANWGSTTNTQSYELSVYYKNGVTKKYDGGGFNFTNVGNVISYAVTDIDRTKATTWYYTVRAVSGGNHSGESNEITVALSNYDGVRCKYESNIQQGENLVNYWFAEDGYCFGPNVYNYKNFAEMYSLGEAKKVTGFKINICALQDKSNDPNYTKITMKLWDKNSNGQPNNVLYSEDFAFSQLSIGENALTFAMSTVVPAEFFIGYEVYYSPVKRDIFGVASAAGRRNGNNTVVINTASNSYFYQQISEDVSLALFPLVCTFAPAASFTVAPQTADRQLSFTNTSAEAPDTEYLWNFGDGQTSTDKNPVHNYTAAGTYTVTLKAMNLTGESVAAQKVTVNCIIPLTLARGRNWYVSSPIQNTAANSVFGTVSYLDYYSEPTPNADGGWVDISHTNTVLTAGKGYIVSESGSGNAAYTFTGMPNASPVSVALTRTVGTDKEGFNLVGNPFLSYINWNMIDTGNVQSTIWYRTKNAVYEFYTYNGVNGLSDPDNLGYSLQYVPPMQAFWVRAKNVGNLIFTDDAKVSDETAGRNPLKTQAEKIRQMLRLQLADGENTDRTVIFADENASNDFDRYDSEKMFGSAAAIYTLAVKPYGNESQQTERLIFNALQAITENTEIPLGFATNRAGMYSISAIEISSFGSLIPTLKDNAENIEFDLSNGESYHFASEPTDNAERFSIVFRLPTDIEKSHISRIWNVWADGNRIVINIIHSQNVLRLNSAVQVYNAVGQLVAEQQLTAEKTEIRGNFASGVYMLKIGNETRKVIIK